MFDLSALEPFIIGFFLLAAVGAGLAAATLVALVQEHWAAPARPVVVISSARPDPGARRAA